MARRKDANLVELMLTGAPKRIERRDGIDLIAEQLYPHGNVVVRDGKDVDHIATRPEGAALKVHLVALVRDLHKLHEDVASLDLLAAL